MQPVKEIVDYHFFTHRPFRFVHLCNFGTQWGNAPSLFFIFILFQHLRNVVSILLYPFLEAILASIQQGC
jgi:hypothetical protein